MSYQSTTIVDCANVQDRLNANFAAGNVSRVREETPLVEMLKSPMNMENISSKVSPGQGKILTVELTYEQRILATDVAENVANPTCSASTKRGNCVATYDLDPDQNLHIEGKFDRSDLTNACISDPDWLAGQIQRMLDVLVRRAEQKASEEIALLMGGWSSDVTVNAQDQLVVETLQAGSNYDLDPFTLEDIQLALEQTSFPGALVIGGATLYQYLRRMQRGCCANNGSDLLAMFRDFGMAFRYSRFMEDALGNANNNLVIAPGAAALIEFNSVPAGLSLEGFFRGQRDYAQEVIVDPQTGLMFDLYIKDNCGSIEFNMFHTAKVVNMPDDMFPTGDRYDGVNYLAEVLVTNT